MTVEINGYIWSWEDAIGFQGIDVQIWLMVDFHNFFVPF